MALSSWCLRDQWRVRPRRPLLLPLGAEAGGGGAGSLAVRVTGPVEARHRLRTHRPAKTPAGAPQPRPLRLGSPPQCPVRAAARDGADGAGGIRRCSPAQPAHRRSAGHPQLSRAVRPGFDEPPSLRRDLVGEATCSVAAGGGWAASGLRGCPLSGPADHSRSRRPRPEGPAGSGSSARSLGRGRAGRSAPRRCSDCSTDRRKNVASGRFLKRCYAARSGSEQ